MALFCLFFAALWLLYVITRKKCTVPVEATLIGCKYTKWNRTPIVRYNYDGTQYEQSTIDVLPKRKMSPFHKKRCFIVYVNPNNPRISTVRRKSDWAEWFTLLLALIFLFLLLGYLS